MADAAVVNASPLIFLAKAGLVALLRVASPHTMVPEPVALKIGRRGPDDVTAKAADVYRYMNFDQIAEFKEVADTVTV